jgi:hypothetical protein
MGAPRGYNAEPEMKGRGRRTRNSKRKKQRKGNKWKSRKLKLESPRSYPASGAIRRVSGGFR